MYIYIYVLIYISIYIGNRVLAPITSEGSVQFTSFSERVSGTSAAPVLG